MYTVVWTFSDKSQIAAHFHCLATALYNALEHCAADAVRAEITDPSGKVRAYRLKGI
jgi:hypothetical protein